MGRRIKTKKVSAACAATATFLSMIATARVAQAEAQQADPEEPPPDESDTGSASRRVLAEGGDMRVVQEGSWIRYEHRDALPQARTYTITGRRITRDGELGCRYSGTDEEGSGGVDSNQVTVTREVANNIDTCTMTLETATISQAEAEQSGLAVASAEVTDDPPDVEDWNFQAIIDELDGADQQIAEHIAANWAEFSDSFTSVTAAEYLESLTEADFEAIADDVGAGVTAADVEAGVETVTADSELMAVLAATRTTGRYQKLYYEDPPGADTTSVTSRVRWTYTGKEVTASRHGRSWGWLEQTGWGRESSWWGHDRIKDWGATTNVTARYSNPWFCGPGGWARTFNEYYANVVTGRPDGSSYYQWDADKWGGCENLLSFHRTTGSWSG